MTSVFNVDKSSKTEIDEIFDRYNGIKVVKSHFEFGLYEINKRLNMNWTGINPVTSVIFSRTKSTRKFIDAARSNLDRCVFSNYAHTDYSVYRNKEAVNLGEMDFRSNLYVKDRDIEFKCWVVNINDRYDSVTNQFQDHVFNVNSFLILSGANHDSWDGWAFSNANIA